jgi:hypothetical protein
VRPTHELRVFALLAPLALAGCLGGQTGQARHERPPAECPRTPFVVQAGEPTSLGVSARSAADAVRGPWREPLTWHRSDRRTVITVEVTFTAEDARLLQASADADAATCGDELELDVGVELATDDGLLAESLVATLRVTSELDAHAFVPIDLAALSGSYDAASEFDLSTWKDPELNAQLWFSNGAFNGSIYLNGDDPNPDDGETVVSGAVASWPEP